MSYSPFIEKGKEFVWQYINIVTPAKAGVQSTNKERGHAAHIMDPRCLSNATHCRGDDGILAAPIPLRHEELFGAFLAAGGGFDVFDGFEIAFHLGQQRVLRAALENFRHENAAGL